MAEMPPRPPGPDDDRPFFDVAVQTMPAERLRALREQRLRETLRRVLDRPVPFFAAKLRAAGIEAADDVACLEDLAGVPVTVKQELRDSEAEFPPVGDYRSTALRDNVKIGTSTGTTGAPTIALWTAHDLDVDCAAAARMFWATGVRPGHIVTHAHPSYLYAGGPLLTLAYERFGCLTVHVPPPDTDELAEQGLAMWRRVTPDFPFMGFATGTFFTHARRLGIDPLEVGLDFSKAPNLGGSGGALGLMTAGAECFPYLGSPCANRAGAHLADDFSYVEAVGEDDRGVPDGEWGRLVVTTFGRDNVLLRYDLEEAVKLDHTECGCGATSTRGWWGGRFKDLVTVAGRSFMLHDLERVLGGVADLTGGGLEYRVHRPSSRTGGAALRLDVEVGDGYAGDREPVRAAVVEAFERGLGLRVDVDLLDRGTLPRAGFKTARVVDD